MTATEHTHAARRRRTTRRTSDPFGRRASRRRLRFALIVATAGVFTALLAVDLWNLRGELLPRRAAQTGALVRDNPQAEGNVAADVPGVDAPAIEASVTTASMTEASVNEAPVTEAPITEAPITDAPVADAPVADAPATAASAVGASAGGASVTGAPAPAAPLTAARAAGAPTKAADSTRVPPVAASMSGGVAKPAAPPRAAPPPKPARDPHTDIATLRPPDTASLPNRLAPVRFVIPQPGSRLEFAPSGELSERLVQAARRGERIVIRGRVGQDRAPADAPTDEQDAAARAERARRFLIVRGVPAERIWIGASVRGSDGDRALIIDVSTRGDVSDDAVLATAPTRALASPGLPAGGARR